MVSRTLLTVAGSHRPHSFSSCCWAMKQGGAEMTRIALSRKKRQLLQQQQQQLGCSFGKVLLRKPPCRRLVIVNELAGQYEDSFEDVKTQMLNYFTYKAVRTVLHQLYEMNPPSYTWFYNFVASNKPGDGKGFLKVLVKENQELAERVMTTRLHLYAKWIKKCNHAEIYKEISDENLELMRERLMETVIWPSDDTNPDLQD